MEVYLDANATTPVLAEARTAALSTMEQDFGNPSSVHGTGLKARALIDSVRATARRVLGIPTGQLLFLSGATEGIQTAVISVLSALSAKKRKGEDIPELLLYGATEHSAVPATLKHWNELLDLGMQVLPVPVALDGRHDLIWLKAMSARAGMVCTMAANNETGVMSDLDGIQAALDGSPAYWMVDSVQALGKLDVRLGDRPIDYAPFSGHKLYAPKGIGMLYVREGAPFTPLMAGGGQEAALRSGTENMPGIAALGAVLALLEKGNRFMSAEILRTYRERLIEALSVAFPGIAFNAPTALCLPTTLNFSVPGLSSKLLLDLFDAAEMRISGGSACSASKAQPSHVLVAMGLPEWQIDSAVRLSFGPATEATTMDEACLRISACGTSLRDSCLTEEPQARFSTPERITRFNVNGACCYVVADAGSKLCAVVDPLEELTDELVHWVTCRGFRLAAILDTHTHGEHMSSADQLRQAVGGTESNSLALDALGWPVGAKELVLGDLCLTRLPIPGHTADSTAYLLSDKCGLCATFVGDAVMPGALGRSDFAQSDGLAFAKSLRELARVVGMRSLLLPGHDYEDRYACTLASEAQFQPLLAGVLQGTMGASEFALAKSELEQNLGPSRYSTMVCGASVGSCISDGGVELQRGAVETLVGRHPEALVVDVREPYEQRLGQAPELGDPAMRRAVALSSLSNALLAWTNLPASTPVLFYCRSGNRSMRAALALRRLGHSESYSIAGGLALWPKAPA